jgi:hypothetical protein
VLHEQHSLTFRIEAFNMLNHTVLSNPTTALNSPQFGIITSAGSPRLFQLAMKYAF